MAEPATRREDAPAGSGALIKANVGAALDFEFLQKGWTDLQHYLSIRKAGEPVSARIAACQLHAASLVLALTQMQIYAMSEDAEK